MNPDPSLLYALQLLGNLWLHEVRPEDISLLKRLPGLGDALPGETASHLTELATEFQRLFGFNLPPYESLYVDPSGMLNAPATALVEALYREAGWSPPADARYGAPDHLGLELLALGDFAQNPDTDHYKELLTQHLALWAPLFTLTLARLEPHPFYTHLGELTQDLVLESLTASALAPSSDPFPILPPPPVYRGTIQELPETGQTSSVTASDERGGSASNGTSLGDVLAGLLTARQAGFYITRQDLADVGIALDLPGVVGERAHMLKTLLQLADQYDLLPSLFEQLQSLLNTIEGSYADLAAAYPAWQVYARAWFFRLGATRALLRDLHAQSLAQDS